VNYKNLCYSCFSEKPIADRPCPKCGYVYTPNTSNSNCLTPGTLLHNRYLVGEALGVGGFGITYKCLDTKVGGICAVKEYMPASCAMRLGGNKNVCVSEQNLEKYNRIMKRFKEEAELVKTFKHPNVITIHDNFYENNTAYYVMEYCDGIDLRKYSSNFRRKLSYEEGMNILFQTMNGLEYIHSKGVFHRDIAPDNIYVTKNNTVKILDFGSARSEMDQINRELSVIVKVGYAPLEQYGGRGKQGPYTDIYALGATFYHLFTGVAPVESTQRVAEDTMAEFSRLRPDLPDRLKYCIEKAMALTIADRIPNIGAMKKILGLTNQQTTGQRQINRNISNNTTTTSGQRVIQHTDRNGGVAVGNRNTSRSTSRSVSRAGNRRASIGSRAAAYLIDSVIWSLIVIMFAVAVGATMGLGRSIAALSILGSIVLVVLQTVMNTVLEMTAGATLGKMMLGLRVTGAYGQKAMPGQVLLRNLVKLLGPFTALTAGSGLLLQDKATDSSVCEKE